MKKVLLAIALLVCTLAVIAIVYFTNMKKKEDSSMKKTEDNIMFDFLYEEVDNKEESEKKISYLEQKYSIVFPEIIKELYARTNSSDMKMCEIKKGDTSYVAACLVPLVSDDIDFEYAADDAKDEPLNQFIPDDWYPIAYDQGGAYFYWSCKTKEVYFVLPDDIENPILIADSIEEFFKMLNNSIVEEVN